MPRSDTECVERCGMLRSARSALERNEVTRSRGVGGVRGVRGVRGACGSGQECVEYLKYVDRADRAEPPK